MDTRVTGHHVTAIASDPRANADFDAGVLGLRLVKRTVDFDDPETYHFYFGDELGRPGTLLTFFPAPGAAPGRRGAGQATATALAVPPGSLDSWRRHLEEHGVPCHGPARPGDGDALVFTDPDGLLLELVEDPAAAQLPAWTGGPVPAAHAVRAIHRVTLISLAGAVLSRPMVPLEPHGRPDLGGVPVFIAAGRRDPMVPAEESQRLARLLEEAGAAVTLHWAPGGHELTGKEVDAARRWLAGPAGDPGGETP